MVQKNKIKSASGNGIDVTNPGEPGTDDPAPPTNVVVRKNKVEHAQLSGIEVSATGAGEYQVLDNRSLTNAGFGIHFGRSTVGGTRHRQHRPRQREVRLQGPSQAGNEHLDRERRRQTSEPAGLCSAPTVDDHPDHDGKDHGKKHKKKHHKKTKKHKQHRPDPCQCTLPWRF